MIFIVLEQFQITDLLRKILNHFEDIIIIFIYQLTLTQYSNMITKRKTQKNSQKSKQKIKTTRQGKQVKKIKKDTNQKLMPCASKKTIKIINTHKEHQEEIEWQNQNENRSNLPLHFNPAQKIRINNEHDINREYQGNNMRRSASLGGLKPVKQVRKSLSPVQNKETKQKLDIKYKYSSRPSNKPQKQKFKQHANLLEKIKSVIIKKTFEDQEKQKLTRKKSEKIIKNQSQRLKTQDSSKVPQIKEKQEKGDKISQKKVKSQKTKNSLKSTSIKLKNKSIKLKEKKKGSIIYSDVSFHDQSPLYSAILPKQNFYVKLNKNENTQENRIVKACITIQRHFRGYLTRKYIEQSKYMLYCVIKIQKVWRGFSCRKKFKKQGHIKKNLSIQNSLITVKDFSQEPKQQKLKNKTFKFEFDESSIKKQSSSKKFKREQQEKYINILQSLLQEEGLEQKIKQKIRVTLGKQKYVQNKIYSEIISQKSFNSPRQMKSPRSNIILNSPSSWNKQKPLQVQNICLSSPRNIQKTQVFTKRINSPIVSKQSSNSKIKFNSDKKNQQHAQIEPFQATFSFIEQFQLKIVDFLRDHSDEKQNFLENCKKSEQFRTNIILAHWNHNKKLYGDDSLFLLEYICPDIFPSSFRQKVMNQSSMKLYLEDNNYIQNLWMNNTTQSHLYEGFIKCIFDGLAEAIYENYQNQIITHKLKSSISLYVGHRLFQMIFMNSLTTVQGWNQYMCGAQIPVHEDDPNYRAYCDKNIQRIDLMVKDHIAPLQFKDKGCWTFHAELNISEIIFQELIDEFNNQYKI